MNTYNIKDEIRKTAYSKYQLNWMSMHGYGLDDIISRLNGLEKDEPNRKVETLYQEWEYNSGFNGELWACYDEFLSSEYKDRFYMRKILDDYQYAHYLDDIGKNEITLSAVDKLSVRTPLGEIYARFNGNFDYPGIMVSVGRDEDFADTPGCLMEYTPDKNRIQIAVYSESDEPEQIITVIDGQQNEN